MDTGKNKVSIENFGTFFRLCLTYAAIAIIIGVIVNILSIYIQDKLISNKLFILWERKEVQSSQQQWDSLGIPLLMIIIQLIFMTIVLFIFERYIAPLFGRSWQDITPGLFFVAIYFSTQYNLFRNITSLGEQVYKKNNNKM